MIWFFHQVFVPVLVIGMLVFIHELGHFLLAKWCNVGVVKFSIGFGPAIFKFRYRETIYQLSIIPLGGFVRMVGDMPDVITGGQATDAALRDDAEEAPVDPEMTPELAAVISDRNRWFVEKNFWQRSAIVFAGPLFNYILTFVLMFVSFLFFGIENINETATIGRVAEYSAASEAGLQDKDLVLSISGKPVDTWEALAMTIKSSGGLPMEMHVKREGGVEKTVTVTPKMKEIVHPIAGKQTTYLIGIEPARFRTYPEGPFEAAYDAGMWTYLQTVNVIDGLWGMFTGKVSTDDLAGPWFILSAASEHSKKGVDQLLAFVAILSVSLGVLNLLPIPILDGGHLMFFVIEAILGPISIRKKEFAQSVGMLFLLGLMVFAIRNDIKRDPKALEQPTVKWEPGEGAQTTPPAPEPSQQP